jgi:hypothetical protein
MNVRGRPPLFGPEKATGESGFCRLSIAVRDYPPQGSPALLDLVAV